MIYKYLLITFMTGLFSIQALSAEWTNNSDIKIIFDEKNIFEMNRTNRNFAET